MFSGISDAAASRDHPPLNDSRQSREIAAAAAVSFKRATTVVDVAARCERGEEDEKTSKEILKLSQNAFVNYYGQ